MLKETHDPAGERPASPLRKPARLAATLNEALESAAVVTVQGRVKSVLGNMIRATAANARIGELCNIQVPGEAHRLEAEVVGFVDGDVMLAPMGEVRGISSGAVVTPAGHSHSIGVGPALLGRILDGFGRPLDGQPAPPTQAHYPVYALPPDPLSRALIEQRLHVGVRVIDGLLACAEGQRLGIFAAAGCGKTTLLGMLVRNCEADVIVIALVGERGREVREFVERELDPQAMRRCVVVCSTSDRPAAERVKAGFTAMAVAEYFRDQGQRVLLLMDSLTRLARAQRELGLAAGEPPTRRGFPSSVFTLLPALLERTGLASRGSITAFFSVLVEADDMNEPIADETRSILDGHIILSRKLAGAGHFPAVDVLASVSRIMGTVASPEHMAQANRMRELMAKYEEVELLVRLGEYKSGSDALADESIAKLDGIRAFLRQPSHDCVDTPTMVKQMKELVG